MKKILIIVLLLSANIVFAHQPRLVDQDLTIVENPEISQAFYGELTGEPAYYQIQAGESFSLYVGILVPDIPNIDKDVSVGVYKDDEFIALLDGTNHEWVEYYEEFAGDNYFWGPEYKDKNIEEFKIKGIQAEPGIYTFEVFSPDNLGKYVFVVGEIEEFPADEIVNTFKILPKLKTDFFEKSVFSIFSSRIGTFLLIPIVLIIGIIFLVVLIKKKK